MAQVINNTLEQLELTVKSIVLLSAELRAPDVLDVESDILGLDSRALVTEAVFVLARSTNIQIGDVAVSDVVEVENTALERVVDVEVDIELL